MNGSEGYRALLLVEDVRKYFPLRGFLPWSGPKGYVRAVDGISLEINSRETVALVGESGCGKTTTAKLILRLDQPTAGRIIFRGLDIQELNGQALREYRSSVQAVFQDPWSSLDPRMRAVSIVAEPLVVNSRLRGKRLDERVISLLQAVGLDRSVASNYPHELSGGMRQRLAIARAIALHPSLIVLDEPVSALDVSIRAQIMNLLKSLQASFDMAYLLISHDLATVRYLAHRIAVMYLGEIVESTPAEKLFSRPLHPYSKALLSAAPAMRPQEKGEQIILFGDPPSPVDPPSGCRFHPRCPFAFDRCLREAPRLKQVEPDHRVACHLY